MEVAFAFLEDRITPVFDTAQRILIAEVENRAIRTETVARLIPNQPMERAKALAGLGVQELVCGAISADLRRLLASQGIHVIPFVAGDLRKIMQDWLQGRLGSETNRMPGCHRRSGIYQEGDIRNRAGHGYGGAGLRQGPGARAQGKGCGPGQGRLGPGAACGSSPGGPAGTTPLADCLCPRCGHHEPHGPGTSSNHKLCPACGTAMTRESPLF